MQNPSGRRSEDISDKFRHIREKHEKPLHTRRRHIIPQPSEKLEKKPLTRGGESYPHMAQKNVSADYILLNPCFSASRLTASATLRTTSG